MHQVRPYLDLGDAVEALKFIIAREGYNGETYNVVTLNATVNDIVEMISSHVPDLSFHYVDSEIMNQLSYRVSNDRFRSLGFEFKGDLKRGISQTLEWLRPICRSSRPILMTDSH